jgi:alpha-tubulin suppressor-like RCC1 family protein
VLGANTDGRLGDGSTTQRTSPVHVGTDTWKAASAGGSHTCGIRSNGTLWCWGNNADGRLGDGTTTNRPLPTQVGGLSTWDTVELGVNHTFATLK